jgi:hypothetical protein
MYPFRFDFEQEKERTVSQPGGRVPALPQYILHLTRYTYR